MHKGAWKLSELKTVKPNGLTVFSCFHCGGGSTMGYKLAGYSVLGGVEIDPKMMAIYQANHKPKHSYLESVSTFKTRTDLPFELYNLDILDGSPPCSSFSMAGSREKAWGDKKKFREGQAEQVLDDLFFEYIDIATKLKPKIVVAENVQGLVSGKARGYVKAIFSQLAKAGYDTQLFLLNAATMGVPQARRRVFFIARRRDLNLGPINLEFSEAPVSVGEAFANLPLQQAEPLTKDQLQWWTRTMVGDAFSKAHPKGHWFNAFKLNPATVSATVCAATGSAGPFHWAEPRKCSGTEYFRLQSFPDDFNCLDEQAQYVCGMSVPPFMVERIAKQIELQWLSKLPVSQGLNKVANAKKITATETKETKKSKRQTQSTGSASL